MLVIDSVLRTNSVTEFRDFLDGGFDLTDFADQARQAFVAFTGAAQAFA
jgi:hypothetical protein